jgi:dienelactone hydrolase
MHNIYPRKSNAIRRSATRLSLHSATYLPGYLMGIHCEYINPGHCLPSQCSYIEDFLPALRRNSTPTLKTMRSIFSILTLLLANTGAGYLLPSPPGRYNVTLTTGTLTDHKRDARALMLSVFQPAICACTVPVHYMPNKTAEYQGSFIQKVYNISINLSPLFLKARLPVCPDDPSTRSLLHAPDAPILLLSPGYRGTRLYYNFLASAIASEGFVVITIDHPGETNIITYPDGHAVTTNLPDIDDLDDMIPYAHARAADASFIIDQLSNTTAMDKFLPRHGPRNRYSPTRVAMAGHSLGGAAAMLTAAQDPRIRGAINWDGPFIGPLPVSGISQPMLTVAMQHDNYPSLVALWERLHGPKLWIKVARLSHEGMLDVPTLLQAAGKGGELADLLGSMAPDESVRILMAYATEWMKGVFVGKVGGALLQGREPGRFSDVSIVRRENF